MVGDFGDKISLLANKMINNQVQHSNDLTMKSKAKSEKKDEVIKSSHN